MGLAWYLSTVPVDMMPLHSLVITLNLLRFS